MSLIELSWTVTKENISCIIDVISLTESSSRQGYHCKYQVVEVPLVGHSAYDVKDLIEGRQGGSQANRQHGRPQQQNW